jgi:two-component system response regulator PilR (NtrC family)
MPSSPAANASVLVVDDEPSLREMLSIALRRSGYAVVAASGVKSAVQAIITAPQPYPLIVTDLVMPDGSGLEVLGAAKKRHAATEVIVMTAHSTVEAAIEAMRGGAYDFVVKPFSPAHMLAQADKALEKHAIVAENQRLRAQLERFEPPDVEFGTSAKMRAAREVSDKIAATKTTVLITGESGTGKERIARYIHDRSERKDKPFRVVNCGALPEALMESELFGHVKGAFTGAVASSAGLFREAEGGTVLLDEIGELPAPLQVKLLRVLQERRVRPVGAATELPVDVRVLAATNRDVEADVKSGRFRQDLYYRLNVIRLELPPLRDRKEDIPRLADRFLKRFASEMGKDVRSLAPDAMRALGRYGFPGNVRELENILERAVALASGPVIGLGELPPEVSGISGLPSPLITTTVPAEGVDLEQVLGEVERRLILQALEHTHGVRKNAAKLLRVTFRSLRYRLEKHGIDVGDGGDGDNGPVSSPGPDSE